MKASSTPNGKGGSGSKRPTRSGSAGLAKHWGERRAVDFFRGLVAMRPNVRKGHVLLSRDGRSRRGARQPHNYASNAIR